MKAVFFIIDYVPHQIQTIKNLIEKYNFEVMAFHAGLIEKYIPEMSNFNTYNYQKFTKEDILKRVQVFKPDLVVNAGWMIKEYVWLCKKLNKGNLPIVSQSDTQWKGTFRQKINATISPLHLKKAFTHMWVGGYYQYEYARKLGFENEKILFNSLSANTSLFNKVDINSKKNNYPKNLLFIGRFSPEKGIFNLVDAWNSMKDKKNWKLTLIGNGKLKAEIRQSEDLIIKDYMSQENLLYEMQNAGAFVLPSTFEQWSLVLHEAAAAGLPIICTNLCGASPHFVINNFNGYKIMPENSEELRKHIEKLINKSDEELLLFSERSRMLGNSITPESSLSNLMQVLI